MEAGVGGGNCAGLVAVAAVSAAVTLATVRLYRGLESDIRRKIQLQHGTYSSIIFAGPTGGCVDFTYTDGSDRLIQVAGRVV